MLSNEMSGVVIIALPFSTVALYVFPSTITVTFPVASSGNVNVMMVSFAVFVAVIVGSKDSFFNTLTSALLSVAEV